MNTALNCFLLLLLSREPILRLSLQGWVLDYGWSIDRLCCWREVGSAEKNILRRLWIRQGVPLMSHLLLPHSLPPPVFLLKTVTKMISVQWYFVHLFKPFCSTDSTRRIGVFISSWWSSPGPFIATSFIGVYATFWCQPFSSRKERRMDTNEGFSIIFSFCDHKITWVRCSTFNYLL